MDDQTIIMCLTRISLLFKNTHTHTPLVWLHYTHTQFLNVASLNTIINYKACLFHPFPQIQLFYMLLFLQKLKLEPISKLENQHHHQHPFSPSLQPFLSHLSNYFHQISSHPKPGSHLSSLIHIPRFLEILSKIHKAFARLLVEIEYPMTKWQHSSIDQYLDYSINLLQLVNSISSSLSTLKQDRLSLSHTLCLVHQSPSLAANRFLQFQSKKPRVDYKTWQIEPNIQSGSAYFDKERVFHLALTEMKKIGSLVCDLVLSSLSNDAKYICLEMRKSANEILDSSSVALDLRVSNAKEECGGKVKEFTERLQVFSEGLFDIEQKGDCLFSQILASRNELLDTFRMKISN